MAETGDVVIIGGGAAGCAVAYYLALSGIKATIIEREGIGSQASGFSAGGLNPLEGAHIPGPLAPLAMESFKLHRELWGTLSEESGINFQERIVSLTKVAFNADEVPALEESLTRFNSAGDDFSGEWLERQQLLELEPRLSPQALCGVSLRGNAALDSFRFTRALATAAERRGAAIRIDTARGVRLNRGRVERVILADAEIDCSVLVWAAGPWSREAEPWFDLALPVDPLKGEILRLQTEGQCLAGDFNGAGASLYPRPDGLVWCGATEEWQGFNKEPTDSARAAIWEAAARLMPELAQARLVRHTACLRPVTPDWLPIIGRASGWDNVYLATGAGKKGILLSLAIGKATAQLIVEGSTSLSIDQCSPGRFAPASATGAAG